MHVQHLEKENDCLNYEKKEQRQEIERQLIEVKDMEKSLKIITLQNSEISKNIEDTEAKVTILANEKNDLLEKLKQERAKVNEFENGTKGWEIVK